MTSLPEKLRLKEMAEEDLYFARRDRELVAALRRQRLKTQQAASKPSVQPASPPVDYRPHRPGALYRRLLNEILQILRRQQR